MYHDAAIFLPLAKSRVLDVEKVELLLTLDL